MEYTVTSYCSPDLDGISCMYAYAEFLNKIGKKANYYIEGNIKKEIEIVCELFNISLKREEILGEKIIIVDTNSILDVSKKISADMVVEIVDHHTKSKECEKLKNVTLQIEKVGAAATLIAEKFKQNKVEISRNSSILLYYAIISNTINLKSNTTCIRDIEIIKWLKEKCMEIDDSKIKYIFEEKSKIHDNLREEMEAERTFYVKNKIMTIAQLELVDIQTFLSENKSKIKNILEQIKIEKKLDYIFLNCIDIWEGYNVLVTIDKQTEELISKVLEVKFEDNEGKTDKIYMRKEIIRRLIE